MRSNRFLSRYYEYEQKLSSLFLKIEFKDIMKLIMEDIDSTETDIKIKVRDVYFNIFASRFDARPMSHLQFYRATFSFNMYSCIQQLLCRAINRRCDIGSLVDVMRLVYRT